MPSLRLRWTASAGTGLAVLLTGLSSLPLQADTAADYAALISGVPTFPITCCPGSMAVHGKLSFPVLVEPTGTRRVLEAAGYHSDNSNGARGVAFTHDQWGTSSDARVTLVDNAVIWASKKATPGSIRIGLGPGLNSAYFTSRGFIIKNVTTAMGTAANDLSTCDVFLANWHSGYTAGAITKITNFTAMGGGIVLVATPWALNAQAYADSLTVLTPFGVSWASAFPFNFDFAYTNVQPAAYSANFSAIPGATNLLRDRQGITPMTMAEKIIAANAIEQTYAIRGDLAELNLAVEQLSTNYGWITPTRAAPLTTATQPVEAMLGRYQSRKFDSIVPAQLFVHPGAVDWPGLPAPGPLVHRTVAINGNTHPADFYMNQGDRPTRRETALYVPPGTNTTLTIPPGLTGAGLLAHIGGTEDDAFNYPTWRNFPRLWRRVPLTNVTTSIGHVFGGLISVLVPTNRALGTFNVTISNALDAPVFNLATDNDTTWNSTLKWNPGAWGYLQTSNLVIYLPRWQLTNANNMTALAQHWASVMGTADRYYGYAPYRKRPEVISPVRQLGPGIGAYAGYPIESAFAAETETELQTTLASGNWGSYHELGHGFQDDFDGAFNIAIGAEIDVNLLPGMALTLVHDWTTWEYDGVRFFTAPDRASRRAAFLAWPAAQQTWSKACTIDDPAGACYDFYYNLSDAFGWQVYSNAFGRLMRWLQGNPDAELSSLDSGDTNYKRNRFYLLFCVAAQRNLDTYFQRYGLGVVGRGFEITASVKTLVAGKGYPVWTDNQPISSLSSPAPLNVSESLTPGTVLYIYTAIDPEPGTIFTYSITSGNDGGFSIDKRTGTLRVGSRGLDYERAANYSLQVVVSDNGVPRYFRTNTITVNVSNAPEPPGVGPQLFTVANATPAGTVLGTCVATVEAGRTLSSWSIVSGNAAGLFALNPASGQLTRSAAGTLPNPGLVELMVAANDSAGWSGLGIVRVLCNASTGLREERWTGQNVFTGPPAYTGSLPSFTTPVDVADNYSRRVSGYLIPQTSDDYTFWVASDDDGRLYLSAGSQPSAKVQIASVNGYTAYQSFDQQGSQKSGPIQLQAGLPYYIEATQIEGSGGDHMSVAWAGGAFGRQIIPGTVLVPNLPGINFNSSPPLTIAGPASVAVCVGGTATLAVSASHPAATYQWQRRAPGAGAFVDLAGIHATAATFLTPPAVAADDGAAFRVVVSAAGNSVTSSPAQLSVITLGSPTAAYDFNSGVPPNTAIYGHAFLSNNVLELNRNAQNQSGAFLTTDLAPGRVVRGFAATFKARLDPGTTPITPPADGFSFNWAPDLTNGTYTIAEEGSGSGLRVCFDTWDNGGAEAPAIDVWWNTNLVARRSVPSAFLARGSSFVDVQLRLSPDGLLDLIYACESVFARLPVVGSTPQRTARFGLGGRTGVAFETQSIDDLTIELYLDPTNGIPHVTSIVTQSPAGLLISGVGTPNQSYAVEASTDLVTWTWRANVTVNAGGLWQFFEPTITNPPWRFYRLLAAPQFPPGLVNWWRAESNHLDSFGPYDGTPINGLGFTAGQRGQAFNFDGLTHALHLGGVPLSVPWTACFWVRRQDASDPSAALVADDFTGLKLEQAATPRRVGFTQFGVQDYAFNYTAPTNAWTHLAFVATPSGTILYANGTAVETNAATVNLPRTRLGLRTTGQDHLRGQLDETTFFNRALTPAEVQQVLNATRGP